MLRVRDGALVLAFVLAAALWPAGSARAGETWIVEIQRYLDDGSGRCAPEVSGDLLSRRPEPGPVRNTRLVTPGLSPTAAAAHGISCIQGTRIARAQGFDHIEVVSCEDEEYYVYEGLRGRIPWRMVVSRFEALIVHAAPLD